MMDHGLDLAALWKGKWVWKVEAATQSVRGCTGETRRVLVGNVGLCASVFCALVGPGPFRKQALLGWILMWRRSLLCRP